MYPETFVIRGLRQQLSQLRTGDGRGERKGVDPRINVREGEGDGEKVRKEASTVALGYAYGPFLAMQALGADPAGRLS